MLALNSLPGVAGVQTACAVYEFVFSAVNESGALVTNSTQVEVPVEFYVGNLAMSSTLTVSGKGAERTRKSKIRKKDKKLKQGKRRNWIEAGPAKHCLTLY